MGFLANSKTCEDAPLKILIRTKNMTMHQARTGFHDKVSKAYTSEKMRKRWTKELDFKVYNSFDCVELFAVDWNYT